MLFLALFELYWKKVGLCETPRQLPGNAQIISRFEEYWVRPVTTLLTCLHQNCVIIADSSSTREHGIQYAPTVTMR